MNSKIVSVVVPVYRSQITICELINRLRQTLTSLVGHDGFEIILIDDNSPDQSWNEIKRIYATDPSNLKVIKLMRNFGQHNAIMCGFHQATGQYIVTIDDDLQNPPEEIPTLYQAILSTHLDVVYGDISQGKKHTMIRNFGSWLVVRFAQIVFQHRVPLSSFRIMKREVVQGMIRYDHNFTYVDGLIAWCTQNIGSVPVKHEPRLEGRSGYSVKKLVVLALNMFTNFSLIPLQVVSLLGICFALCGFALGVFYSIMWIFGKILVSGYASLIVSVLVLGGVQLLAIGVIGEYVGRIHLNMNRKPQFIIREQL